jgi:hypothetical protein
MPGCYFAEGCSGNRRRYWWRYEPKQIAITQHSQMMKAKVIAKSIEAV